MKITFKKHILHFKFEAGTSRGVLLDHSVYFVKIYNLDNPNHFGLGECAPLKGLSVDYLPNFEAILSEICIRLSSIQNLDLEDIYRNVPETLPSIRFGLETALLDFKKGGIREIFSNDFSRNNKPIEINGLIWMGDKQLMKSRIKQKIEEGYKTLKLKIGAINFKEECNLLAYIREIYHENELSIRLDANGAFSASNALEKLEILSEYKIHSIEQPIAAGQRNTLKEIIINSPIPIALDEELIGIAENKKFELLSFLAPPYIILKPTLLGGFNATKEWIQMANNLGIKWWITSALESNIGLNAISQFTAEFKNSLPHGLGTGQLYKNNIDSPLKIENGKLFLDQLSIWNLAFTS